ncbi:MAG TPA: hypothetical protein VJU16_08110, partial [Planctomycetota bacterium]|nr:hypothetical protein [Planctomycetota bacterium]
PSRTHIAVKPRRWGWKIAVAAAAILVPATLYALMNSGGKPVAPAPPPPTVNTVPPAVLPPAPPAPVPPPAPPRPNPRLKELAAKGPLKPDEELDFQLKASGFLARRQFDELDKLAEEALIRGPEAGWAHYFRAFVALERGDHESALKHADRALALGLNRTTLYELRFDIRLVRAEYKLALEELERLFPRESVSLANQEILRLDREISHDPSHAQTYIRRGAVYLYRRAAARAAEDFAKAISSGDTRAEYFLALALKEDDKSAEAAEAVRRFLAAHGSLPGATEAKTFLAMLTQ